MSPLHIWLLAALGIFLFVPAFWLLGYALRGLAFLWQLLLGFWDSVFCLFSADGRRKLRLHGFMRYKEWRKYR